MCLVIQRFIAPLAIAGALTLSSTSSFAQITVGKNVQVSLAHAKAPLGEIWIDADARDPNHLLSCGIVYSPEENRRWTAVYVSMDRGKTWKMTLETKEWEDSADPACAIGPNGMAHHIAIGTRYPEPYAMPVYRSTDGGLTWTKEAPLSMKHQGVDRQSIIADQTNGKFSGQVYIVGESSVRTTDGSTPPTNGMGMWVSTDKGKSFPTHLKMVSPNQRYTLGVGNSVVMADGTVATVFGELKNSNGYVVEKNTKERSMAVLSVFTSKDGGESIEKANKVDDYWMAWPPTPAHATPAIGVDVSNTAFKDRLYVTFADERSGRFEIYLAMSSDTGKTWSRPVIISDDRTWDNGKGPNNFLPSVAVNKDGVVGVMWYDRREHKDNMGWDIRFRASLDGGETWLSSVKVSEKPNVWTDTTFLFTYAAVSGGATGGYSKKDPAVKGPLSIDISTQGRQFNAGDYANIVADAGGQFHALWVDNRTGRSQIWTAPVDVKGVAVKNGGGSVASLEDIGMSVTFELTQSRFDRSNNTVTILAQLHNRSKDTVVGPIKGRVVSLSSQLAHSIQLRNPSEGNGGPGSIVDFSDLLDGGVLLPNQKSRPKQLVFKMEDLRPMRAEEDVRLGLVSVKLTVLGKLKKAASR
jgi:hypothetical protein